MDRRGFSRRSGRVIATGRALLAVVFLVAVWLEPSQPARPAASGYALLTLFLLWSAALVAVAWRSWWYDFRLGGIAHCVDMLAFVVAAYFTEAQNADFASPFLTFTAFLLIAATTRWGLNGTVMTAVGLVVLNIAMAGALHWADIPFDLQRFGRRTAYMGLLALVMVWLGLERRSGPAASLPDPAGIPGEQREDILVAAVQRARTLLGARQAAIALSSGEEPWTYLVRDNAGECRRHRIGPGELSDDLCTSHQPTLFDTRRERAIVLDTASGRAAAMAGPSHFPLAALQGVDEGIALTVSSAAGTGQLLLWDMDGPAADDLVLGHELAEHIGRALDRDEMARLAQSAAVSGIRNAIARDLHDSVAQFLAGTLFRLEALRRWIRDGNDPEPEINGMKEALRREQAQLRLMIERLRRGEEGERRTDLVEELGMLLTEIGLHWHIETDLAAEGGPLPVSIQLAHELRQIVREAVANAVRHGRCSRVELTLGQDGELLRLMIRDDGEGFPDQERPCRPRSISERVEALGGHLFLGTGRPGAHLDIELPVRIAA